MRLVLVLLLSLVAVPAFSQDDCPAGHVRHPAVSPLDHASMVSAFTASFRGLFGRDPSMQPGSGKDDGEYYISASNHYGVYGDDQCHAGWSGYWESWLSTGHGDLALVQTPARFQPSAAPVPPPIPPQPPPVPAPMCDLSGIEGQLVALTTKVDAHAVSTEQFQADVRHWRSDILTFIAKYGAIIGGTIYGTCKAAGSC